MAGQHHKSIKHIHEPGHLHELTFSCYRQVPLLTNDKWCAMLAESIDRAMERHAYQLLAFVFMPDHVHLLVFPEQNASPIPALLKAIKRPFSFRVKQSLIKADNSDLLERLTIQQRPGKTTFRFWQEGPGYDRNLTNPQAIEAAIDYIHCNPVKKDLCQQAIDWKWSSARELVDPESCVDPMLPKLTQLAPEFLDKN